MRIENLSQGYKLDFSTDYTTNDDRKLSFGEFLNSAISKVNDMQIEAKNTNEAFAMGKIDNIHQVMLISEKADLTLQFTMQVRNKILDAYNEIMRMPI